MKIGQMVLKLYIRKAMSYMQRMETERMFHRLRCII